MLSTSWSHGTIFNWAGVDARRYTSSARPLSSVIHLQIGTANQHSSS